MRRVIPSDRMGGRWTRSVAVVLGIVMAWPNGLPTMSAEQADQHAAVEDGDVDGVHEAADLEERERALRALRELTMSDDARQTAADLVAFQIDINPEARVKLRERTPPQRLVRQRTHCVLVEVHNEAGLTAPLRLRAFDRSLPGEQEAGWFHVGFVENGESTALLSGARTEWKLIEFRCDEVGTRTVRIAADAGTGTQDLGFRAEVDLVIDVEEQP